MPRRDPPASERDPDAEANHASAEASDAAAVVELSGIPPELADLAGEYLERRRTDAETLRRAAAAGEFEQARRVGHNIKGSGAGYGFERISELGIQIEQAAQRGDAAEIERAARELSEYADKLLGVLS